jgi:hypothetical protein
LYLFLFFQILTKMDSVKSRESFKNVKFKSEAKKITQLQLSEEVNQQQSTAPPQQAVLSNTMVTVSMSSGGYGPATTTVSLAGHNATHQPVKPSQLGLKTIIKPAGGALPSVSTIVNNTGRRYDVEEEEQRYLDYTAAANAGGNAAHDMEDRFGKSVDLDRIVWPTLRKKLAKNYTLSGGVSLSSSSNTNTANNGDNNATNVNSPGADFYENQEVKVTVL